MKSIENMYRKIHETLCNLMDFMVEVTGFEFVISNKPKQTETPKKPKYGAFLNIDKCK